MATAEKERVAHEARRVASSLAAAESASSRSAPPFPLPLPPDPPPVAAAAPLFPLPMDGRGLESGGGAGPQLSAGGSAAWGLASRFFHRVDWGEFHHSRHARCSSAVFTMKLFHLGFCPMDSTIR